MALLFSLQVYVPIPDAAARHAILVACLRKANVSPKVDLDAIVTETDAFSGADLAVSRGIFHLFCFNTFCPLQCTHSLIELFSLFPYFFFKFQKYCLGVVPKRRENFRSTKKGSGFERRRHQ